MTDWKARIDAVVKRRDNLNAQKERVLGRLEEAEKNVATIRAELQAKKVDPDNLDQTIQQLEKALSDSVAELEKQVSEAEALIKPYQ